MSSIYSEPALGITVRRGLLAARWLAALLAPLAVTLTAVAADSAGTREARIHSLAPLTAGDEPVIVSEHTIRVTKGPLNYEARAGRLSIRDAETGQVRGRVFFVAYVVTPKRGEHPRPLTFAWNGGPGAASSIIHLQGLGPRRIDKDHMIDNAETPLATSDLVFMDAMETGFSRPENPEFAREFFTLKGDVAATSEFIRAYRTRFRQVDQPVFIAGESFGVFRAAALADYMIDRDDRLDGVMLISGDFPNVRQSIAFYDAMHIPARVATAFHWKRLAPELMQDYAATMRAANEWVEKIYLPALDALDEQTPESREKIAVELARWTGMRPDQIDRETLVVHAKHYLEDFFDGDKTRKLDEQDARTLEGDISIYGPANVTDAYLRSELGYATDLTYNGVETGYTPALGPKYRSAGSQFIYDIGLSKADEKLSRETDDVTYVARDNPPWMQTAMTRNKKLEVYVATGRYDPLNMCEGDIKAVAQLPPNLSNRIETQCYEAGHIIYQDLAVRSKFLSDLSRFIRDTVAGGS
jgi:carboxypeptidase C (cathepsin A)